MNWRLLDREIVDEVIKMASVERDDAERCDENYDPLFHRLLKSLWQGGFETSTTQITPEMFDSAEMTPVRPSVIETGCENGNCVIVGRGAQCLLADRDDALHVFIWAPRAWRVRRVRERLPMSAPGTVDGPCGPCSNRIPPQELRRTGAITDCMTW